MNTFDENKQEHFSQIENQLRDKINLCFITNSEGIITFASQKFCDLSKFSKEEIIGKNPRIFKSGAHDNLFYEEMWNTIKSGKIWTGEIQNKTKDGSIYWQKSAIVPYVDEKNIPISFLTIRFDITQTKKLEEELSNAQKMNVIGELSAHLAHDIRNPLATIANEMELLKPEFEKNEEKTKSYQRIQRAILRIDHQITDVLNFVKKQPRKLSRVDVSEIVSLAINNIVIPDKIKINYPRNSIFLTCDPYQIETLFVNLILNSINAISDTGEIHISISERNEDVLIDIQDSGSGISEELLDVIFEPMFTTRQFGTGLGLAICKNIVDMQGGDIFVKNNPTTFTIILPKKLQVSETS